MKNILWNRKFQMSALLVVAAACGVKTSYQSHPLAGPKLSPQRVAAVPASATPTPSSQVGTGSSSSNGSAPATPSVPQTHLTGAELFQGSWSYNQTYCNDTVTASVQDGQIANSVWTFEEDQILASYRTTDTNDGSYCDQTSVLQVQGSSGNVYTYKDVREDYSCYNSDGSVNEMNSGSSDGSGKTYDIELWVGSQDNMLYAYYHSGEDKCGDAVATDVFTKGSSTVVNPAPVASAN